MTPSTCFTSVVYDEKISQIEKLIVKNKQTPQFTVVLTPALFREMTKNTLGAACSGRGRKRLMCFNPKSIDTENYKTQIAHFLNMYPLMCSAATGTVNNTRGCMQKGVNSTLKQKLCTRFTANKQIKIKLDITNVVNRHLLYDTCAFSENVLSINNAAMLAPMLVIEVFTTNFNTVLTRL